MGISLTEVRDRRVSAREALRQATRQVHTDLHRLPLLQPLMTPEMTAFEYGCILTAFLQFYVVWEPRLQQAAAEHGVPELYPDQRRTQRLRADLQELPRFCESVSTVEAAADDRSVSDCGGTGNSTDDQRPYSIPAALAGALYVIEGSAFGGQAISDKLKAASGRPPSLPVRYFAGDGERTAERWRMTLDFVERAMTAETDRQIGIEAACQTFGELSEGLQRSAERLSR